MQRDPTTKSHETLNFGNHEIIRKEVCPGRGGGSCHRLLGDQDVVVTQTPAKRRKAGPQKNRLLGSKQEPGVFAHSCNASISETEPRGPQMQGYLGLHTEALSQKKQNQSN